MYEAYRVLKRLQWRGWEYAPNPSGPCECSQEVTPDPTKEDRKAARTGHGDGCTEVPGTGCEIEACGPRSCRCACQIPVAVYAGDIILVESGHPHKDSMMFRRFFMGDASIPSVDELMADERYSRLIEAPKKDDLKTAKRRTKKLADVRV